MEKSKESFFDKFRNNGAVNYFVMHQSFRMENGCIVRQNPGDREKSVNAFNGFCSIFDQVFIDGKEISIGERGFLKLGEKLAEIFLFIKKTIPAATLQKVPRVEIGVDRDEWGKLRHKGAKSGFRKMVIPIARQKPCVEFYQGAFDTLQLILS